MHAPHAAKPGRRRRRGPLHPRLREVRRRLAALLIGIGGVVLPPLYLLYMAFVWRTSRVVDHGFGELARIRDEHGGAVGLLWHEEVLTVGYGYRHMGFRPLTLASRGDAGEIVTRVLERCGFSVLRGGASRKASRHRPLALRRAVERMRDGPPAIFGITVDGSQGPRYRLKPGGLALARDSGRPIVLVRTWYRRCLRLPTWDRTGLPLPWNEIHYYLRGPYTIPPHARGRESLEPLRRRLEAELADLAVQSHLDVGQRPPEALLARCGGGLARRAGTETRIRAAGAPAHDAHQEKP